MTPKIRPRLLSMLEDREHAIDGLNQTRESRELLGYKDSKPHLLALMIHSELAVGVFREGRWREDIEGIDPPDSPPQRSVANQAQTFLLEKRRSKSAEYAAALAQDPTGLTLIGRVVEELKEDLDQVENYPFCKEYVLAGAELARDAYKILYTVTE